MDCDTGRHHSSLKKEVNSNVRYKVKTEGCPEQIRATLLFLAVFKRRVVPVERERLITFLARNGIRANHLLDAELRQYAQKIQSEQKMKGSGLSIGKGRISRIRKIIFQPGKFQANEKLIRLKHI